MISNELEVKIMRAFLAGLFVGGLLLIVSLFLEDTTIIKYLLLLLGAIPMLISGVLSGSFVSGDRVRANYTGSKDFSKRTKLGSAFFLFGLSCFLVEIAIYYI
ncbi:hypothetical protein Desor_3616 [Desulfosporosinus orientis DSM 765]|uniref:Uncharacterized protein n=2 Tax=Desulfosporosinus orientis TaxID=1563 RepID=G7WIM2_DESOD|nr:hypothetical protein Desor_3616 [Desulfosporosinus orientis DSM 765]